MPSLSSIINGTCLHAARIALFFVCTALWISQNSILLAQPNVIVIICDDLNDSVEGMGGHPDAITPNIDALSERGVRFTNAHCNAPICGPSRASLWSGLLPSTTGYYGYNQQANKWRQFPKLSDAITLMEHFKANGYSVYGSGKIFHNGHTDNTVFSIDPSSDPDGPGDYDFGPFPWDGSTVQSGNRQGSQHPSMPSGINGYYASLARLSDIPTVGSYTGWSYKKTDFNYVSNTNRDLMPDEITADWVGTKLNQSHTQPFLIIAGMNRPHAPFYAPDEFFELFEDANGNPTVSLPPYLENDLDDIPEIMKPYSGTIQDFRTAGNGNDEWWKKLVQAYLACVAFADAQVGKIITHLDNSTYANNTIVVFISDHGYHIGEKDHKAKTTAWEETTRVPFVISAPGVTVANQECNVPISLIDLYPTLNALCNLPADPNGGTGNNNIALDGNDLTPLLSDPSAAQWEGPRVSLSHLNSRISIDPHTESPWSMNHHSVRSTDHHYILASDGSEELYDHTNDPNEWVNQASNSTYVDIKADLKQHLFKSLGFKNENSIITNGGFENGSNGWGNFGPVTLTNNSTDVYEGNASTLVSGRTNGTWNGIKQDLISDLEPGKTYHFSAWTKMANPTTDTVKLNIRLVIDTGSAQYINLGTVQANNTEFRLIEGDYTVPYGVSISEMELTLNGPAIGEDFYLDHVQIYPYTEPKIVASLILDNGNGAYSIDWNAELGVSYRLEQSLGSLNNWNVLESNVTADKTQMTHLLASPPTDSKAFWRVVEN
ncbi:MAG: Choline-sulfatase [Opitutia bacterium UBA7350]|nr:MAG: Choline-sulfatase [Opitutae bacterium UBA7350]